MELQQKLKEIGLNTSEGTVYLYLLKNGLATPPQIAKGTKIARTNTYNILRSLQEKNLIQRQRNRKRFAYVAKNPESLLTQAENIKTATQELLPELRALHRIHANKPSIQFYDGWDEVKEIYNTSLESDAIHALGSIRKLNEVSADFFLDYSKQLKKRHIIMNDILTADSRDLGNNMTKLIGPLYTAHFLDAKLGALPTDILIWDDNIALISLETPIFGTVITNANLAKTFCALHASLKS